MDNLEPSNNAMYIIDEGMSFINTVKDVGLSINMIVITIILTIFYNPETYKLTGNIFKKAPFVKISKEMYLFMIHTFLVTLILGLFFYFKDNYILQKVEEENEIKMQSALVEIVQKVEEDKAAAELDAVEQENNVMVEDVPEGDGEVVDDGGVVDDSEVVDDGEVESDGVVESDVENVE